MRTGGLAALFLCILVGLAVAPAQQPREDAWKPVAEALGRAGEEKDGVYRVSFPRSDLRVRVSGVNIRTGLALTSWAAFQQAPGGAMVMGDLVLAGAEVSPVISRLAEGRIEVTALHNHLVGEQPRVMYLHFHGHGDAAALATVLRRALAETATPLHTPRGRTEPAVGAGAQAALDADQLGRVLGYAPVARGGVVSFSIARAEKIVAGGTPLGPRMGVATAINFQAEGSGAVTTGDFVLLAEEVQPVIRALREHGLEATALHNHMLDEQPRLFFLHFWGRTDAEKLARGLRAALDKTRHAH
jgi:hypothetical protein